ncbi:DUF4434 domain-containing protein [Delftia sp. PS-11]|uniref:DUF4434 domain-containing protein n=1 Tax=Delftia sp. PS-11 TaxID=2767222 RepID=UPI002457655D|nr:DUF4434 domain-containing protein [Delftia sp. PS-11]KAJ8742246.1 DUF4434 domain-containing protein [Delftia sp. PS-11]
MSLSRRTFLGTGAVAATAVAAGASLLAGCSSSLPVTGSFLQPWRSHLTMPREQWRKRLADTYALGCRELFVQWTGILGETPAQTWRLADTQVADVLDICAGLGMGVHLGLPYDERWWKQIDYANAAAMAPFLAYISDQGTRYMASAVWPRHAAFRGWYIPYELEQYHWSSVERGEQLVQALKPLVQTAMATSGKVPAISTYFSQLKSQATLAQMWDFLLDRLALHPMVQDGVGVAGLQNYAALAPLQALLQKRGVPFDLIVELFTQLSSGTSTDFNARTAEPERVRRQWEVARDCGAERIVAFAIDPWVLDDTPEAQLLRSQWKSAVG